MCPPDRSCSPHHLPHMHVLTQVYAPVDGADDSFHRTIFLFVSPQVRPPHNAYACMHIHTHTHAHACQHTCTQAHAHAQTHTDTHTQTHARTHAHTHTHTRTHARTCACMPTYMHPGTRAQTATHTTCAHFLHAMQAPPPTTHLSTHHLPPTTHVHAIGNAVLQCILHELAPAASLTLIACICICIPLSPPITCNKLSPVPLSPAPRLPTPPCP